MTAASVFCHYQYYAAPEVKGSGKMLESEVGLRQALVDLAELEPHACLSGLKFLSNVSIIFNSSSAYVTVSVRTSA